MNASILFLRFLGVCVCCYCVFRMYEVEMVQRNSLDRSALPLPLPVLLFFGVHPICLPPFPRTPCWKTLPFPPPSAHPKLCPFQGLVPSIPPIAAHTINPIRHPHLLRLHPHRRLRCNLKSHGIIRIRSLAHHRIE